MENEAQCVLCGKTILQVPNGRRKYCGSQKTRDGCAWKVQLEIVRRYRNDKQRGRPKSIRDTKSCVYCHKVKDRMLRRTWETETQNESFVCRECNTDRKKRYRETTGAKAITEASKRARVKHGDKWRARAKVRYAVKIGKIKKPECCEACNEPLPLHGHHHDYSKPLEVVWLCSGCHADEHRRINKLITTTN